MKGFVSRAHVVLLKQIRAHSENIIQALNDMKLGFRFPENDPINKPWAVCVAKCNIKCAICF